MSKLPDDGDPWAPNNLLTPEQKKNTSCVNMMLSSATFKIISMNIHLSLLERSSDLSTIFLTGSPLSPNVTTGIGNCIIGFHWLIQKIDNPIKPSVTTQSNQ